MTNPHTRARHRVSPLLGLLLLASLAGTPARAQDQARPPCWHEEFASFSFLEGEWEVQSTARLASGEWETTTARSTIQPDLNGCLLVERYRGSREGRPFEAMAIHGFNAVAGRLQRIWVDGEHGSLVTYEGQPVAKEIPLDYQMMLRGQLVTLRHAYFDIGSDAFSLESRRSNDGGRSWTTTWKARYSRSKPGRLTGSRRTAYSPI